MNELITPIRSKIYIIRGKQVMIDRDLAELYQVENRALNQAVKRNSDRFPDDFMFQLTKEEFENWKSQIVISNSDMMGLRKMPYAFTEEGVYMLSSVLRSPVGRCGSILVTLIILSQPVTKLQKIKFLYSFKFLGDIIERLFQNTVKTGSKTFSL